MAPGNERSRAEPSKSKSRPFISLGQSLRRGLTTRRSNKNAAQQQQQQQQQEESQASSLPASETAGPAADRKHATVSAGTAHSMGMHSTLSKSSYKPSPLSRNGPTGSSSNAASLGLGSSSEASSSIYGNGRAQRIASASGVALPPSGMAGAGGHSGGSTHFRKTLYGSTALAGLSKSGYNSSSTSLGGSGPGTGNTASAAGGSSGGPNSGAKSDTPTLGRKAPPPPPSEAANSGPQNATNRDYSFAIASNHHANVVAQSARSSAGTSITVTKEGYLSKKTDINPSTSLASALSRGWKVYRVVLKGAKLFFYKPPSESELREMFPEEIAAATNETAGGYFRTSMSVSAYDDAGSSAIGFPMAPGEVESSSRAVLFEPGVRDGEITAPLCERYSFGECFTEVDLRSLKFKRYVCVLIFDDTIVVLKRRWVRQGLASSFFGAVSNKMRFGKSSRAKAQQATDNTSLVSAELGITGKGYFTKWKYHSQYPLTNVEAIEAASSRFSVTHSPGVLGHLGRESQTGSSRLSLYSIGNSSVSSVMTRTSTVSKDYSGALSSGLVPGFQIFVNGKERVARMFVATTSDAKNNWLSRFAAAKSSYARRLRQRPRENTGGGRRYNGSNEPTRPATATQGKDQSADVAHTEDKSKPQKDTRTRLFWGTQRHPELVVAEPESSNANTPTDKVSAAAVVIGGSKSALVHEMIFRTAEESTDDSVEKLEKSELFSMRLVGTYPLMMTHSEFLSELQRYAGLVTPEAPDYVELAKHLGNIIKALATYYATVYDAEQIEILRSIVSQSIKADLDESAVSQINTAIDRMVPVAAPATIAEDAGHAQTAESNMDATLPRSPPVNLDSYEIIGTLSSATAPKQSTDAGMRPLRGRSKTHHGDALPSVPQIPSVPELIRVEITGLSPSMLLRIAPAEFAHQLYLFHKSQLADFNPKQAQLYLPLPPASPRQDANGVRQPTPSLLTVGAVAAAAAVGEADGSPHGASGSQTQGSDPNGVAGANLSSEAALHAQLQMQRQLMVFTHGEPHFITRMIHHQLLVELPLNRPARRSALLQHWVRIGEEARIIGDAITWAAVAMAITMAPIARLRETWHGVGVYWKDLIVTEWVPLLISHGIYEVDIDVPGRTAESKPLVIRPQNKSGASTPSTSMSYNYTSIPFYGPIRMHIARQGMRLQQKYQQAMSTSRTGSSDQGERLLFAHFGFMYSAAQEAAGEIPSSVVERARTSIMRSRASSVSLASKFQQQGVAQNASSTKRASGDGSGQRESVPSNTANALDVAMQGHPYLQAYLQGLAQNPLKIGDELVDADVMNYDVRYLLSVSLQCEPAVSDQYHQHLPPDSAENSEDPGQAHALVPLSLRQAPGSILPLVCPETVPSTNILQWITPAVRTPAATAQTVGRSNGPGGRAGTFSHTSDSTATNDTADSKVSSRNALQSDSASSTSAEPIQSQQRQQQQQSPAVKHKRSRSFPANGSTGVQMDGDGSEATEDAAAECDALFAGTTVYAANGDLALRVLRVQYGMLVEKAEAAPAKRQLRFVVEVQGGTQPILLDLLVNGIAHYSAGLTNEKGTPVQVPAGSAGISLVFNRDVYQRTFLASFRHFGGALEVIDSMRRSLAQCSGQAWSEISGSLVSLVDVCENWLSQHFADFLDSTAVREAMAEFVVELQRMMQSQKADGVQSTWNDLQERVELLGPDLVTQLLTPSGFTELDRVLDRRLEIAMGRERRTSATAADAQVDAKQAPMSLLSVAEADELLVALNRLTQTHFARCSYNDWLVAFCLLEVQTYMPLPWYAKKRLAHLPPEEELVVSDIYQVLEQTQRGRGTAQTRDLAGSVVGGGLGSATASFSTETSLARTLPQSIQTMLELHRTIRGWAIRQIADPSLTLTQRVARIQRFLSLIRLCRKDSHLSTSRVFGTLLNGYMREAAMIPERQPSYRANSVKRYSNSRVAEGGGRRGRRRGQAQTQNKYVPSFVERAIASALVSPESRMYVRAWNTVAAENNTKLDTLEAVLRGARSWAAFDTTVPVSPQAETPEKQQEKLAVAVSEEGDTPRPVAVQRSRSNPAADSMDISEDSMARADCFVPCVGWLLENMISLCYDTPDTLVSDARLVNLAKRHRVFIMLCVCDQLVARCQEALALPTRARIDLAQLSSWIVQNPLRASEIQQAAQRELALPAPEAAPVHPSPVQGSTSFTRPGDTMTPQTLRQGHSASFAKRSIANLRSVAAGPANDQRAGGFHPRRSTAVEFGAGGGQVFGSPPAPAPRSLTYGEGPGAPGAGSANGPGSVYVHPFVRLVTDEVEKVRQEIRERERLERELRDREQAIERQKNERTKMLKRQLKEQQQRRAKNEPLLKMANLMNKVGISARDSSIDGGSNAGGSVLSSVAGGSGDATGSVYGGLPEAARAALPDGAESSRLSGINRPRGPALPSAKPANVINLINSTITVEQAYTKRDYVFRIITEEGGQYLLQAPDQDQMEDWMSAMRDAATEAAARRLTLFVEEAKKRSNSDNSATPPLPTTASDSDHGRHQLGSETTRSRFTAFLGAGSSAFGAFGLSSQQSSAHSRGALPLNNQQQQQQQQTSSKEPAATSEPKSFGVELTQQMPDPQVVPAIVEKCLTEIELRGLEEVGIYRVSGAAADVSRLRALFNADPDAVDLGSGDFPDINVVSGVMKQFLRELPEPLMTFGLYDGFINAASIDDYDERLWAIKDLVHALPAPNYTVLKRLVEHLERVTDYEEINHMYGTNLALVFGPSLLRPPPGSSSFALAMSNLGHAQSVIKNLILQYHWIFNVEEEAEPLEDDDNAALPSSSQSASSPSAIPVAPVDGADKKPTVDSANEDDDDDNVPLAVAKRESVAVPLSPTSQADMDQLTVAVNNMSVSP